MIRTVAIYAFSLGKFWDVRSCACVKDLTNIMSVWNTNNRQIACFVSYKPLRLNLASKGLPDSPECFQPTLMSGHDEPNPREVCVYPGNPFTPSLWAGSCFLGQSWSRHGHGSNVVFQGWSHSHQPFLSWPTHFCPFRQTLVLIARKPNKFIRWQPSFVRAGVAGI